MIYTIYKYIFSLTFSDIVKHESIGILFNCLVYSAPMSKAGSFTLQNVNKCLNIHTSQLVP